MKPIRNIPPIDAGALERIALRYVERYATTRAKLTRYLERKLYERGWEGSGAPPIAAIVARFVERRYVDDRAFAEFKAAALNRRGYGRRRIADALRAAGIDAADFPEPAEDEEAVARSVALAFARRRRIGPFAAEPLDRAARQRAFAMMVRAGHPAHLIREILETFKDDDTIA